MKKHTFRITVEHLADDQGNAVQAAPLRFEVGNHDDILAVVERLKKRPDFDEATAQAFGVGLKLFGEVMLEHRGDPLFAPLLPHFGAFMQGLKKPA